MIQEMKFKDYTNKLLLKDKLKEMRLSIIKKRLTFKNAQRANAESYAMQQSLLKAIYDYRHMHIAYSMMSGKSYDQIERKTRIGNEASWYEIGKHMKTYGIFRESDESTKEAS